MDCLHGIVPITSMDDVTIRTLKHKLLLAMCIHLCNRHHLIMHLHPVKEVPRDATELLGHSKSINSFSSPLLSTCMHFVIRRTIQKYTASLFASNFDNLFHQKYTYWWPLLPPARINFELMGGLETTDWFGGVLLLCDKFKWGGSKVHPYVSFKQLP